MVEADVNNMDSLTLTRPGDEGEGANEVGRERLRQRKIRGDSKQDEA